MPHSDPAERKRIARQAVAAREKRRATKPAKPAKHAKPAKTKRSGVLSTIEDYDAELGRPANWGDAKRREEVRGELVLNEARAEDLESKRTANAKARGELVDSKTVERRDEVRDAIFQSALAAAVDLVGELAQPAQVHAARARAQAWLDERRAEVAAKLDAMDG